MHIGSIKRIAFPFISITFFPLVKQLRESVGSFYLTMQKKRILPFRGNLILRMISFLIDSYFRKAKKMSSTKYYLKRCKKAQIIIIGSLPEFYRALI